MTGFPASGFPSLASMADAWIDRGRGPGRACELMIALERVRKPFWLEFTAPDGTVAGWIRFEHVTNVKNRAIYGAAELRPGSLPAPDPRDVWLAPSRLPQEEPSVGMAA